MIKTHNEQKPCDIFTPRIKPQIYLTEDQIFNEPDISKEGFIIGAQLGKLGSIGMVVIY